MPPTPNPTLNTQVWAAVMLSTLPTSEQGKDGQGDEMPDVQRLTADG